jgi:hypothetical protein
MIPTTFPSDVVNNVRSCIVFRITPGANDVRWKDYIPVKTIGVSTSNINTNNFNGAQAVKVLTSTTGLAAWRDYIPVAEVTTGTTKDAYTTSSVGYIPIYDTSATLNLSLEDKRTPTGLTYTRAGDATRVDASSDWSVVKSNLPRFTYDQNTQKCLGLLVEYSCENKITNSNCSGIGGSNLPDNWSVFNLAGGVSYQVLGTGNEASVPYVDIRIFGNCTSAGYVNIVFESGFPLVNDLYLSQAAFIKRIAGTNTNIFSTQFVIDVLESGLLINTVSGTISIPTTRKLSLCRLAETFFVTDAEFANNGNAALRINCTEGAVDYTLRIGYPEVQNNSSGVLTSPTDNGVGNTFRAADLASLETTFFSSWYSATEGTFVVSFMKDSTQPAPTAFPLRAPTVISLGTGTSDYILVNIPVGTSIVRYTVVVGGVTQCTLDTTATLAPNTTNKIAFRYKLNDFAISINGGTPATAATGTVPTVSSLLLGRKDSLGQLNGVLKNVTYYPKALSNSLLQTLSTDYG